MNWVQKAVSLFQKSTPLSIRDPAHWRNAGSESYSGELSSANGVLALSTAWACVNLLAGTIGSLPLNVYRTNAKGEREIFTDHPLHRMLHDSPNSEQTSVDFLEFQSASLELSGNSYARKHFGSMGQIVSLVPIASDGMDVQRGSNGRISYNWTEGHTRFTAGEDEILHVRGFGGGPLGGLSTLSFGRHTFGLNVALDKAAGKTFANGLRPSGTLTFDKFLNDAQRNIVETKLLDKFAGAENTGKPIILEGGTKWGALTINPDDAQMLESRAFSVEEVCRFFGVPPVMVGHSEKNSSWPSAVEQQVLLLQKFTLRRRLKRIEQAFEKQLMTAADRARGVSIKFSLEGLLRGDSKSRSEFYHSALSNGWMTINEVRKLENLPPVKGGDVPRMQVQNAPITEAGRPQKEDE